MSLDLKQETLTAHNQVRKMEGKPLLRYCNDCAQRAQSWANTLAATQQLQHSPHDLSHPHGQNLAMGGKNYSVSKAVTHFYEEKTIYNPNTNTHQPGTGHYTQCVWASTQCVGAGIAKNGNHTYVVCNYCPPGNMNSEYRRNV